MKTLHNNYNYIIMNKQQISKVSKVSKYSMFFHSISNPLHEQAFAGCVERIYTRPGCCSSVQIMPDLMQTFSIDVSTENPKIHPNLFCHACYMYVGIVHV